MKYVMLVGDGMADEPQAILGGRSPVEAANTPNMDRISRNGVTGLVRTVPTGFEPGSDVANMSLLGFDPSLYYSGRAPLEAASLGVELPPGSVAFRCNLVSIRDGIMHDYSSGHIDTETSHVIVDELKKVLDSDTVTLYPGVSYRHLLVIKNFPNGKLHCTPPHDLSDKPVGPHVPEGAGIEILRDLCDKARPVLEASAINRARSASGKTAVTDIWLWGQGGSRKFPSLSERFGKTGAVISAVDLVRGLGRLAGLEVIKVPGATGYLGTNYAGKVEACEKALATHDFIYLHVEAPDETSHEGDLAKKLQAIEEFDANVVGPVLDMCSRSEGMRVIVLPDHPTFIRTKTHDASPVPFAVCGEGVSTKSELEYSEVNATKNCGENILTGASLFSAFITDLW